MDSKEEFGNTNFDLVNMKGVVIIITTYHQLSAIDKNMQFYDPNDGCEFNCRNNHDGYESSSDDDELDKSNSILLKDAF